MAYSSASTRIDGYMLYSRYKLKENRSMPTREEIISQIRNQSNMSKFLAKREVKELPSILWEDEIVENIVQGMYANNFGLLVATNKRLLFIDKGLIRLVVEDFPYDKITSLQYETGLVQGRIIVFVSGNRAEIRNIEKAAVKNFTEFVRARVTTIQDSAAPSSGSKVKSVDSDGMVEQLQKLAIMHKKGMLTDSEFMNAKKKLLS